MQPPASAKVTVPTNNSPLPRGPHTCHHTPPQSSETHLLLTHLQSSLFQRLCTQTHTHIPSCHSLGSLTHIHNYTHRRVTLRCAHTAFPYMLTSAKFFSAQLCSHTCTHTHTNGGKVCGTELSPNQQPHPTERHPHLPHGEGGGRHVPSPGDAPSSHTHSSSSPESPDPWRPAQDPESSMLSTVWSPWLPKMLLRNVL